MTKIQTFIWGTASSELTLIKNYSHFKISMLFTMIYIKYHTQHAQYNSYSVCSTLINIYYNMHMVWKININQCKYSNIYHFRYLVCEAVTDARKPEFTQMDFLRCLKDAVSKYHGDYGTGSIMTSLFGI